MLTNVENGICGRLEEKFVVLNNEIEEYKRKTDDLNIKLNEDYERAKNILEEKEELEKKLKTEIENISKVGFCLIF